MDLRVDAFDFVNLGAIPRGLNIKSHGAIEQFNALSILRHYAPMKLGEYLLVKMRICQSVSSVQSRFKINQINLNTIEST